MKKGIATVLLGAFLLSAQAMAQQKTVTGRESDEQGAPLSAASVGVAAGRVGARRRRSNDAAGGRRGRDADGGRPGTLFVGIDRQGEEMLLASVDAQSQCCILDGSSIGEPNRGIAAFPGHAGMPRLG